MRADRQQVFPALVRGSLLAISVDDRVINALLRVCQLKDAGARLVCFHKGSAAEKKRLGLKPPCVRRCALPKGDGAAKGSSPHGAATPPLHAPRWTGQSAPRRRQMSAGRPACSMLPRGYLGGALPTCSLLIPRLVLAQTLQHCFYSPCGHGSAGANEWVGIAGEMI